MILNDEKTRLQKGDMLAYNEKTGIVMFFRNKQALLFSNISVKFLFFMPNLNFLVFIKLLADTNGIDSPPACEIQTYPVEIRGLKYLSYIF